MRPIIALTCSSEPAGAKPPPMRDHTNQAYSEAIRRVGGAPLLVPPAGEREPIEAVLACAHGILITGGVDIAPSAYGEETHPKCGKADPWRDNLDRWALDAGERWALPLLGICRGIQALAAFRGGTLYQDIGSQAGNHLEHRQTEPRSALTHTVQVAPGSLLAAVVGDGEFPVNSFHHQAIKGVPPGFRVVAEAPDRIVEAIERPGELFRLGVQWHPEDLIDTDERHERLFRALVEAARRRAGGA